MTGPELELLAALYLLYFYECLYWVRPDEQALTRISGEDGGAWRVHPLTRQSFTMLGRRAVLVDPLLLQPGFIRTEVTPGVDAEGVAMLRRVAADITDFSLLATQCRIQAALLLVVLPILLVTHHLTPRWPEYAGVLLFSHALLCRFLWRALGVLPLGIRGKVFGPALLNPLGATRVLDPLAQALYESSR